MTKQILFVDDDPHLLAAFQRNLRKQFDCDVAAGPREALELLQKRGPYAVVVADMRMPGMDGVTLVQHFHRLAPDTVRVILTGNADQQTAMDAVNRGQVFRFLTKPCSPDVLIPALQTALRQHELICAERDLLEGTLLASIHTLLQVLGLTIPEAHHRGQILRDAIRELASASGIVPLWELEIAAELSPLGFASVPHEVLRKLQSHVPLSDEERGVVCRVPQIGHDLLAGIPRLEKVARIVLLQHKNFDGCGFPHECCAGSDIPIGARLLKILGDRLTLEDEGVVSTTAKHTMAQRGGFYDPELLEQCYHQFPILIARPPDGERPPLALALAELRPGQRLFAEIRTPGGLVLATAGHRLNPLMIERLRNLSEIGEVHEPFLIHDEPGATAALATAAKL